MLKPQPYFNQVSTSYQRWNRNVSTTFKYNYISTIFHIDVWPLYKRCCVCWEYN